MNILRILHLSLIAPHVRQGACLSTLSLLTLLICSCERALDFKYHDIPPLPVIEATLSPDEARVGITFTTPMNEPMDLTRYTDAETTLTDVSTGEAKTLLPDEEGWFMAAAAPVIGHEYRLDVRMEGESYSATTQMYGPVEILSSEFSWIHMPYDDVAVLQCQYTSDPLVTDECFWVRVYRNDEIYSWNTQSDRTADSEGIMTFLTMTSRRDLDEEDEDDALRDGDVVTISICKISREMHDYLEALGNDSSGPRLFTATAAPGCLGYLMATTPVSTSLVFRPDEIPRADER